MERGLKVFYTTSERHKLVELYWLTPGDVWELGRAVPAHLPEDPVLTWTQRSAPAFPLEALSRG